MEIWWLVGSPPGLLYKGTDQIRHAESAAHDGLSISRRQVGMVCDLAVLYTVFEERQREKYTKDWLQKKIRYR